MNVEIKYKKNKPIPQIGRYRKIELVQEWSRWVYKIGNDFYFKIDKCDAAIKNEGSDTYTIAEHTKFELELWEKHKNSFYGKYLCPPILYGTDQRNCTWVLQPVCKKLCKGRNKSEDKNFLLKVAIELNIMDFDTDRSDYQWGYLNGEVVLFDYGL